MNSNECGCCAGVTDQTDVALTNRPGLTALAYRVGTHAQFKQRMLARLSAAERSALAGLQTRQDDDFAIALLDAALRSATCTPADLAAEVIRHDGLRGVRQVRELVQIAEKPEVANTWVLGNVEQ